MESSFPFNICLDQVLLATQLPPLSVRSVRPARTSPGFIVLSYTAILSFPRAHRAGCTRLSRTFGGLVQPPAPMPLCVLHVGGTLLIRLLLCLSAFAQPIFFPRLFSPTWTIWNVPSSFFNFKKLFIYFLLFLKMSVVLF